MKFFRTICTVLTAFFGVASSARQRTDAEQLRPIAVIITGCGLAIVLVILLVILVRVIVSTA